jgi:hypothetical protein
MAFGANFILANFNTRPPSDGDGATGEDNDNDDDDGNDDSDGDGNGVMGSGATGYDDDNDGDGRQRRQRQRQWRDDDDNDNGALLRHNSYRARFNFLLGRVSVLLSTCRGIVWKIFQSKIDPGLNLDRLTGQLI